MSEFFHSYRERHGYPFPCCTASNCVATPQYDSSICLFMDTGVTDTIYHSEQSSVNTYQSTLFLEYLFSYVTNRNTCLPIHPKAACVHRALLTVLRGLLCWAETFVLDFFILPWVPLTLAACSSSSLGGGSLIARRSWSTRGGFCELRRAGIC